MMSLQLGTVERDRQKAESHQEGHTEMRVMGLKWVGGYEFLGIEILI